MLEPLGLVAGSVLHRSCISVVFIKLEEFAHPFKQESKLGEPQAHFIHGKYRYYCYIKHTGLSTHLNWGQITQVKWLKVKPGLAHKPVIIKEPMYHRIFELLFLPWNTVLKHWSNLFLLVLLHRNAHLQIHKWGRKGCVLLQSTAKSQSPIFTQNFLSSQECLPLVHKNI